MKFIYNIVFLISVCAFAQDNKVENDTIIYNSSAVDISPEFSGGIKEFSRYINENYNLPNDKEFKGGKIFTSFVVEKDGSISNIKVLKDLGFGTGIEMVRVLKGSPSWIPAQQNGQKVRAQYSLPITLQLPPVEEQLIYNIEDVDFFAEFPGGLSKFYEFIRDNYRAPNRPGINGHVIVSFVVEVDGLLTDIKILNDLGFGTGDEAVRVLKKSPKWKPAQVKGEFVRSLFMIPISINTVSEEIYPRDFKNYFPNEPRPRMYVPRW